MHQGAYKMNDDSRGTPWLGFLALFIILIIVSIVAFILASIEGFLAGVIAVFIGLLVSFFRDDLKRVLGLSSQNNEPVRPIEAEDDSVEKMDRMIHLNLDKKIAKERQSIAKTIAKYNEKPKKRDKLGPEIVEEATALLALLDQAKSQAIQSGKPDLVTHYDQIALEVKEIQERYQQ
jgi:hypothetical protein